MLCDDPELAERRRISFTLHNNLINLQIRTNVRYMIFLTGKASRKTLAGASNFAIYALIPKSAVLCTRLVLEILSLFPCSPAACAFAPQGFGLELSHDQSSGMAEALC